MADSSDPFEILKQQEAGVVDSPLPASEVRARGDRMRRRRTAFRAVAAAAAVAVVTTGGVALGGGLTTTAPAPPPASQGPHPSPPSPTSTGSTAAPLTEIPADFPIAANIAVTHESAPTELADRLEYCSERPLADASPVDAVSAVSSGGETSETRTLLLFGTAEAATDAEKTLLDAAAACPEEVTNVVGDIEVLAVSDEWPGRTIRTTYAPTSAKFVHVVRAGAALLLTESYLQSSPEEGLASSRESVRPLVEAMEQFRTGGTRPGGGTPVPDRATRVDIPADFPLDLGYPEDRFEETQLVGPGPDVPVFEELEACDVTALPRVGGESRLGVRFTQPEDTRARLLTTFDTVESATSMLERHFAMYRDCPREEVGYGGVTLTQVREIAPGDGGFVAIRTFEQDGLPSLGLELVHVVRVGNSLLLQSTSNEGGGNEKQIDAYVREQTALVAELADALCIFSADGCTE